MPTSILRRSMAKALPVLVATAFLVAVFTTHSRLSLAAKVMRKPRVLVLGGGSSHDFREFYEKADLKTLITAGNSPRYTESLTDLSKELPSTDVLIQASNQLPEPDADARRAIMDYVASGGGLVVAHAGTWYNWPGWPEYNRIIVNGGSRSHDKYGEFEVTVTAPEHPVMAGIPTHFKVSDELYHQQTDPHGPPAEVLATATSPITGKTYPSIWVVNHGRGRIVCIALGHDEKVHGDATYQRILLNATSWTANRLPRR